MYSQTALPDHLAKISVELGLPLKLVRLDLFPTHPSGLEKGRIQLILSTFSIYLPIIRANSTQPFHLDTEWCTHWSRGKRTIRKFNTCMIYNPQDHVHYTIDDRDRHTGTTANVIQGILEFDEESTNKWIDTITMCLQPGQAPVDWASQINTEGFHQGFHRGDQ